MRFNCRAQLKWQFLRQADKLTMQISTYAIDYCRFSIANRFAQKRNPAIEGRRSATTKANKTDVLLQNEQRTLQLNRADPWVSAKHSHPKDIEDIPWLHLHNFHIILCRPVKRIQRKGFRSKRGIFPYANFRRRVKILCRFQSQKTAAPGFIFLPMLLMSCTLDILSPLF